MKNFTKCLIIGMTLAMFLFISSVTWAGEIEIKAATYHPAGHYLTDDAYKLYGNEITKRTNGKVTFKWFLAGSLAKAPQTYKVVESGLADFSPAAIWAVSHKFPVSKGLELPFVLDSSAHGSVVAWEMYNTIPEMREEYSKVKVLGFFPTAISNLSFLGDPPKTIEELKGLRVGAPAPVYVEILKLLGASPQHIKPSDLYMALQRKMLDGVMFPDAPLRSYKLTDLLSSHTIAGLVCVNHALIMNLEKWNQLPADIQKVFEDLSQSAGALHGATLTNESKWVMEELKSRGDKFYYLPPEEKARWKERVQPMYTAWIEELNKKGMDGQGIFDKMIAIAEKHRQNPYPQDAWWGNAGKKRTK